VSVDLIYTLKRDTHYAVDSEGFFLLRTTTDALRYFPILFRDKGVLLGAKLALKVSLRRSCYFGIARDGSPLSTGVLALGYCRYYPVPSDAIVIGEIETKPLHRGNGHATRAIMLAMNSMVESGGTAVFYIDTQLHNAPMIRAIHKLGFGTAVSGNAIGSGM
jgi:hypothetical protein